MTPQPEMRSGRTRPVRDGARMDRHIAPSRPLDLLKGHRDVAKRNIVHSNPRSAGSYEDAIRLSGFVSPRIHPTLPVRSQLSRPHNKSRNTLLKMSPRAKSCACGSPRRGDSTSTMTTAIAYLTSRPPTDRAQHQPTLPVFSGAARTRTAVAKTGDLAIEG